MQHKCSASASTVPLYCVPYSHITDMCGKMHRQLDKRGHAQQGCSSWCSAGMRVACVLQTRQSTGFHPRSVMLLPPETRRWYGALMF